MDRLAAAAARLAEHEADTTCAVCMEERVDTVFAPCGHITSCGGCWQDYVQRWRRSNPPDAPPLCFRCQAPVRLALACVLPGTDSFKQAGREAEAKARNGGAEGSAAHAGLGLADGLRR